MTTKTLTGYYGGYTLKANYNGLTLTETASIGPNGVSVTSNAYIANSGRISATYTGIVLNSGGTLKNNSNGYIFGNTCAVESIGPGTVVNAGLISAYYTGIQLQDGGLVTNSGTVRATDYSGVYAKGAAASVTNSGEIQGGTGVGLAAGGSVTNGSLGKPAGIEGAGAGVVIGATGTVNNFGGIVALGVANGLGYVNGIGLYLANGAITNGAPTDQTATISGPTAVESAPQADGLATTIVNFGSILGTGKGRHGGIILSSGAVTNGSAADKTALIQGYSGITGDDANTVTNFGTVAGTGVAAGYHGVWLKEGGYLTNGSSADTSALVTGETAVRVQGYAAAVTNFGTIRGAYAGIVVDDLFVSGGDVTNATTSALIQGATFGIQTQNALETVTNSGTIQATGGAGTWGVDLSSGGRLTNGSAARTKALVEGYGGAELQGGVMATNLGTIAGSALAAGVGVSLGPGDKLTNGAAGKQDGLIEGFTAIEVAAGAAATVINFGMITGDGHAAVQFDSKSDVLVVEGGSFFNGAVFGGGGTIVLATGTGTVSLPGFESLTVSGSMALTTFSNFAVVDVGSAANFTTAGAATISAGSVLSNAGELTVTGALANAGVLRTTGGKLTVDGPVTGAGTVKIFAGTVDFVGAFNENVDFAVTTGVLELAHSRTYSGEITGLSKTGSNSLDLDDIDFADAPTWSYSGTAISGVLTVEDSLGHTAKISLQGDYLGSTFTLSAGPGTGTTVVDPAKASPCGPAEMTLHQFIAAAASFGAPTGGSIGRVDENWRAPPATLVSPGARIA